MKNVNEKKEFDQVVEDIRIPSVEELLKASSVVRTTPVLNDQFTPIATTWHRIHFAECGGIVFVLDEYRDSERDEDPFLNNGTISKTSEVEVFTGVLYEQDYKKLIVDHNYSKKVFTEEQDALERAIVKQEIEEEFQEHLNKILPVQEQANEKMLRIRNVEFLKQNTLRQRDEEEKNEKQKGVLVHKEGTNELWYRKNSKEFFVGQKGFSEMIFTSINIEVIFQIFLLKPTEIKKLLEEKNLY